MALVARWFAHSIARQVECCDGDRDLLGNLLCALVYAGTFPPCVSAAQTKPEKREKSRHRLFPARCGTEPVATGRRNSRWNPRSSVGRGSTRSHTRSIGIGPLNQMLDRRPSALEGTIPETKTGPGPPNGRRLAVPRHMATFAFCGRSAEAGRAFFAAKGYRSPFSIAGAFRLCVLSLFCLPAPQAAFSKSPSSRSELRSPPSRQSRFSELSLVRIGFRIWVAGFIHANASLLDPNRCFSDRRPATSGPAAA
jgi:hypothetical protein